MRHTKNIVRRRHKKATIEAAINVARIVEVARMTTEIISPPITPAPKSIRETAKTIAGYCWLLPVMADYTGYCWLLPDAAIRTP